MSSTGETVDELPTPQFEVAQEDNSGSINPDDIITIEPKSSTDDTTDSETPAAKKISKVAIIIH